MPGGASVLGGGLVRGGGSVREAPGGLVCGAPIAKRLSSPFEQKLHQLCCQVAKGSRKKDSLLQLCGNRRDSARGGAAGVSDPLARSFKGTRRISRLTQR